MKNISHTINNATKKLLVAALTLASLSPFSLDAMKRLRPEDNRPDGQGPTKKLKTTSAQRTITLKCDSDGTEFNVAHTTLMQSGTLKSILKKNTSTKIPIAGSISSTTMKDMLKHMELVTLAQAKGCSKREIILKLMTTISESLSYQSVQDYKDYAAAASYLNFRLFLQALCSLVAQNFHDVSRMAECFNNDVSNQVYDCLQQVYYLSHHKQLDINNPIKVALDDLANDGLISDDALIFKNNVEKFIIHLITTFQYQTLQSVLDVLSKHSDSLSIKAHQALVEYVRSLKQYGIKKLFDTLTLQGESTLKMALRLVYAKDHEEDLDGLKCDLFFKYIGHYINGSGLVTTELFSPTNLQFVLPLIEPITSISVSSLNLTVNQLASLPDSIGNLVNLTKLSLSFNKLTSLPDTIGSLVNLTKLYLSGNQLASLPDSIGNLVNLKELNLSLNELTSLPDTIGSLVNLEELDLSTNQLTSLPDSIGNLVNLKELSLSDNSLNSLPNSIGNLSKLKSLHLCQNQLNSLPNTIGNLTNLTWLLLKNNQLTDKTKEALTNKFGHINCFTI